MEDENVSLHYISEHHPLVRAMASLSEFETANEYIDFAGVPDAETVLDLIDEMLATLVLDDETEETETEGGRCACLGCLLAEAFSAGWIAHQIRTDDEGRSLGLGSD